ncbi:EAL domain-containing protein [Hippea jasoniae]|uniref:EAL domain-containing protein n=1 Tax=Hippea jasoniae TaxID=944479 RepID=UPI00055944B4|nr:EAL domain-containing protein [Hippea jasoniae]
MSIKFNDVKELFDTLKNISVVIFNINGAIVAVNKTFLSSTGYSFDSIKGSKICDLIADPFKELCKKSFEKLDSSVLYSPFISMRFKTAYGNEKRFSIYTNVIEIENKKYGVMFGFDITQQEHLKRIYVALKEINQIIIQSENEKELFKNICDSLVGIGFKAAVVARIDENKRVNIVHVSGEGREFFERVIATVDGKSPEGSGTAARAFQSNIIAINPNTKTNPAMAFWRDDLLKYNFLSNCAVPVVKNGRVEYVLLVFSEHTDAFVDEYLDLLKELKFDVEFALKRIDNYRYLKLVGDVLDKINEGVVVVNDDCKIEFANAAVEKLTDNSLKQLIGKSPLFLVGEGNRDCKKHPVYRELQLKGSVSFTYKIKDNYKVKKVLSVTITAVDMVKNKKKFVGILRDSTIPYLQHLKIRQFVRLYRTIYKLNEMLIKNDNEDKIIHSLPELFVNQLSAAVSFVVEYDSSNDDFKVLKTFYKNDIYEGFVEKVFEMLKPLDFDAPFKRAILSDNIKMPSKKEKERFGSFLKKYSLDNCFAIPIKDGVGNPRWALISIFDRGFRITKPVYQLLLQAKRDIDAAIVLAYSRRFSRIINVALNAGQSYVVILDEDFRIIYMNDEAIRMHGYSKEEMLGKKHTVFSSGVHDFAFNRRLLKHLKEGKIFSDVITYRTKDGRLVEGYTTIIPYEEDGKRYYISVGRNITEEIELKRKLAFLSRYDSLTGLPNKDEFIRSVNELLKVSEDSLGVCAIVDINDCSYINQLYGYRVGDVVIREIAQRIVKQLKNNDIAGRFAGDKFSIYLENFTFEEDAIIRLNGLLKELTRAIMVDDITITPSFYMGVSFYPSDATEAEKLLARAESALVAAKRSKENEIEFYKPLTHQKIIQNIQLKNRLYNAFKNKEFVLFYQPYYSVKDGKIAGAESLIRWIRNGKVVPPIEFIEVLENSNFMVEVEEYIVKQALETISLMTNRVPLSVNLSAASFKRDELAKFLENSLQEYGLDGEWLTVEIVERVFFGNTEHTKKVLSSLKQKGIRIAVDDFGTGFSSLTYIKELPIDILKIDLSFIRGMVKSKKDLSLVKLIINIAKEFGLKTTAEGVETNQQLDILKELGCDYVQGYLFSKPIDRDAFLKLLSH